MQWGKGRDIDYPMMFRKGRLRIIDFLPLSGKGGGGASISLKEKRTPLPRKDLHYITNKRGKISSTTARPGKLSSYKG